MLHLRKYSALTVVIFIASCVSPRLVDDLKMKNERCNVDNSTLKAANEKLTVKSTEMENDLEKLRKDIKGLERDTMILGTSLDKMSKQYTQINDLYELLLNKNKELLAGNRQESSKLMEKLQKTEEDLQKREDELKELSRALDKKKESLDKLNNELGMLQQELEKRETRVNELQSIIEEKDAAVSALKDKVTSALYGFTDKGITVVQKNGKVYVSLEAKLLFASGSTKVDTEGKKALVKLAKAIEDQKDIEIMVEGHTDTDKIPAGGAIKDNWELSVMRATAVIRILTENSKINPVRLSAAGRGEFIPVDPADTESAKAKNRRIEIILNPKLEDLYKIFDKE